MEAGNRKPRTIQAMLFLLGLLTVVFLLGCIEAVCAIYGRTSFLITAAAPFLPGEPSKPESNPVSGSKPAYINPHDGAVHLVALGDSLTRGVGDLSGLGYIGIIRNSLAVETGKPVVYANLAVSGQTSAQLDAYLNDPAKQSLLKQASLIVFTIGGNDLYGSTDNLAQISTKRVEEAQALYHTHLSSILQKIQAANPGCPIYAIGVYNPFHGLLDPKLHADQYVNRFNQTLLEFTGVYPNLHMVPVFDLFLKDTEGWLASDHFHPNQQGYQRIAARVLQDLAAPAPVAK